MAGPSAANVAAPKGGVLTVGALGAFDNFNPFILRGNAPDTVWQVWQPLFKFSDTDNVTEYAEVARAVRVRPGAVTFLLDPRARFSDGVRVTSADVVWTYRTLVAQGLPLYAAEYGQVAGVRAPDDETVVFTLKAGAGPDTVFNLAGMDVLPEHFWAGRDFSAPLRDFPVGSGPYRVTGVSWGSSVSYAHVRDWWAAGLPVDTGADNFDGVTELFFQDKAVEAQAFRAGLLDVLVGAEPGAEPGVAVARLPLGLPEGMRGLVMNTRRAAFADVRVRQALTLAFDFGWVNRALLGGRAVRCDSYFGNTGMAAGLALPVTDGSGFEAAELARAMTLLNAAGWRVRDFALVNAAGEPMRIEILLDDPGDERMVMAYAHDLGLLGIGVDVRELDGASYARRVQGFDFDMTEAAFPVSGYPGSEQAGYFGCADADTPGSENLAGVCDPAVEAAIGLVLSARDFAGKKAAVQALDAALLRGYYVVPWFYLPEVTVAWWQNRVAKPEAAVVMGVDLSLWWAR